MTKQIDINILGQRLKVQGENSQKIQEYAEYLDNFLRKMTESYGLIDQKTLFMIAGLNLVEKVFELNVENNKLRTELDKLNSMLQTISV